MGRYSGKRCRLLSMFSLTTFFFVVEIVVGYVTNSMALVADSFHMLSDVASLIVAFLSVRMAPRSWNKNTFGWARAEVLGALVNAVFLVALCFSITVESLKRFYEPEDIHDPQMIFVVGFLGLVVNLLGLCLFHEHGHAHGGHGHSHGGHGHSHGGHGHSHGGEGQLGQEGKGGDGGSGSQMNMRGVFLHVLADALGSVVVMISALIMWQTDWEYKCYVDPGLSLILVLLMLRSVWPLLRDSSLILLQTVPTHIEVDALKRKLLETVDGVLGVHEFHVWQLTGDKIIASAHIRCLNLHEYMRVAESVKEFFHNEGIHSTTIQPEFVAYHPGLDYRRDDDCVLSCPKGSGDKPCVKGRCCDDNNFDLKNFETPKLPRMSVCESSFSAKRGDLNSTPYNGRSVPNLSTIITDSDIFTNARSVILNLSNDDDECNKDSDDEDEDNEGMESSEVTPIIASPSEHLSATDRVVRIVSKQSDV